MLGRACILNVAQRLRHPGGCSPQRPPRCRFRLRASPLAHGLRGTAWVQFLGRRRAARRSAPPAVTVGSMGVLKRGRSSAKRRPPTCRDFGLKRPGG
jgi:hypothetical protein